MEAPITLGLVGFIATFGAGVALGTFIGLLVIFVNLDKRISKLEGYR